MMSRYIKFASILIVAMFLIAACGAAPPDNSAELEAAQQAAAEAEAKAAEAEQMAAEAEAKAAEVEAALAEAQSAEGASAEELAEAQAALEAAQAETEAAKAEAEAAMAEAEAAQAEAEAAMAETGDEAEEAAPAEEEEEEVAEAQDDGVVEIEYWDQNQSPEAEAAILGLIADFEAANPGITVRREVLTLNVMQDITRTVFEAGEGPDIIYFDSNPGYGGTLANAGLLLPLDDAYEEFGWNDSLISFSKDWTTFGGSVYGVGHEFEAQGLYWNKNIFADEGLEPPATFSELLELYVTFRERGYDAALAGGWGIWAAFQLPTIGTIYSPTTSIETR